MTSGNYVLPHSNTNRGQTSIKYTGPKAWAETPKSIKDVAFRKPFSKKLKDHILSAIFEELPSKKTDKISDSDKNDLDFDLHTLFSTEETGEFLGFESTVSNRESDGNGLSEIFEENDEEEEFYGFDISANLETIFLSDNSCSEEFLGF